MRSITTPILQIRPAGNMWRVCHGPTVLAFTETYSRALIRHSELVAEGAAERVALRRAQQCQR